MPVCRAACDSKKSSFSSCKSADLSVLEDAVFRGGDQSKASDSEAPANETSKEAPDLIAQHIKNNGHHQGAESRSLLSESISSSQTSVDLDLNAEEAENAFQKV